MSTLAVSHSVFICHSHRDKLFAQRLSRDLRSLAVPVWIDDWRLKVGDSLHQCIGKAIEQSAYVAVLLSPDSVLSRWCQDELEQALAREKRVNRTVILPLLHRRVTPPPFLEGRLYLDFSASYWKSLARLAGFLYDLDQEYMVERLHSAKPRDLDGVQSILHECGMAPGVSLPATEYSQLMDIFKRADIDIPGDSVRLALPDEGRMVYMVDHGVLGARDGLDFLENLRPPTPSSNVQRQSGRKKLARRNPN